MKKIVLTLIVALCYTVSFAQTIPQQEWVALYSSQDSLFNAATAIDVNGNIYVTGFTNNFSTSLDITTIKYDSLGDTVWVRNFDGPVSSLDRGGDLVIDGSCNVYVTGLSVGLSGTQDFVTIKYDSNGVQQWIARYDNGSVDQAKAIRLDGAGNVYVTGQSIGTGNQDFATIKYDNNGVQQWVVRYDNGGNDAANAMEVDASGNSYVTGRSFGTGDDFLTVKYNTSGVQQWTQRYNGTANSGDIANDIALDGSGNVIVTGGSIEISTARDYTTIKYDNSGVQQWIRHHDKEGLNDNAASVAVGGTGDIYVTGSTQSANSSFDYTTIKYQSNGNQQWVERFNGASNGIDVAVKVVTDVLGDVYVLGNSFIGTNSNFLTVKYDNTGDELWTMEFDGVAGGPEKATDLVVDPSLNVYVTGQSFNGSNFDFATVKYSLKEIFLPLDFNLVDFGVQEIPSLRHTYYTNRGQILDTDGNPRDDIKLYTIGATPNVYVSNDKISFVYDMFDTAATSFDSLHRVDMTLVGANSPTTIFKAEQIPGHLNFFLEHIPEGLSQIKGYSRAVCNNVYSDIDMQLYSSSEGMKYYFITNPGGNPDDIVMEFTGADQVSVKSDGGLRIRTSLGNIDFEPGHAYCINPGGNVVPMPWQADFIQVSANRVKFDIRNYPSFMPLIIQVDKGHKVGAAGTSENNSWSTLYSSSSSEVGYDITTDDIGNVYVTGYTTAPGGFFPTSTGAFQTQNLGQDDIFILKFDKNSVRLFATLFGGNRDDHGYGIVTTNFKGNRSIYVTGQTLSTGFPIFPLANPLNGTFYDDAYGGVVDAFILKLDADTGLPSLSAYFGACSADNGFGIAADTVGNVYITGFTERINFCSPQFTIPLVNPGGNAYFQTVFGGSLKDGFIAQFDGDNFLLWSSLFGGGGGDIAHEIAFDNVTNSVYIVGETSSTSNNKIIAPPCLAAGNNLFPICEPAPGGYLQVENPSTTSAFIARFSILGQLLWSSFLGGSSSDFGTGAAANSLGDIYMVGYTASSTTPDTLCEVPTNGGFPLCNPYQDTSNANSIKHDLFITRFDSNNVMVFSSFYGGESDEEPYGQLLFPNIAIDINDNVFLSGGTSTGGGTRDFPTLDFTDFYYQEFSTDTVFSLDDAILLWFDSSNSLQWATLYGGSWSERAYSIAVYKDSSVYITGGTGSNDFPVSCPPSISGQPWCDTVGGSGLDIFIVRFDLKGAPVVPVGISEPAELANSSSINVFPNPTQGGITLSINSKNNADVQIIVYNGLGELVKRETINGYIGNISHSINLKEVSEGIYLINIKIGEEIINKKVIKINAR